MVWGAIKADEGGELILVGLPSPARFGHHIRDCRSYIPVPLLVLITARANPKIQPNVVIR